MGAAGVDAGGGLGASGRTHRGWPRRHRCCCFMPPPCSRTVALADRQIIHAADRARGRRSASSSRRALFAGDLTLRQYAGHGLFPDGRADRRNAADPELAGCSRVASGIWPRDREPVPAPVRGPRIEAALRPARQSDRTRPILPTNETRFMTDASNISPLDQARILSEALPHMQQYDEETIVIKYGGHAMGAEDIAKAFARDIVLLEQTAINPVVVHGGGPQIATMLQAARHQIGIRGRPAHHRCRDHRDRRDGAGRLDQQAAGRLHQRSRRQGGRPLRQGRQHGEGVEGDAHHGRSGFEYREGRSISASSANPKRST